MSRPPLRNICSKTELKFNIVDVFSTESLVTTTGNLAFAPVAAVLRILAISVTAAVFFSKLYGVTRTTEKKVYFKVRLARRRRSRARWAGADDTKKTTSTSWYGCGITRIATSLVLKNAIISRRRL